MLREINAVLQDQPGLLRRWFQDDYFDLFVWLGPDHVLRAFQLAYQRTLDERVLEWSSESGFVHSRVDSGEQRPNANRTPLLVNGGPCPVRMIARQFDSRSKDLEAPLRDAILAKLRYARRLRRLYRKPSSAGHGRAY
jgi:hypothetical protein